MEAMVLDADVEYDSGLVFVSTVISLIAATAAYWILFRLLALYPQVEVLRLISSVIAAIAVNGMHYTGKAVALSISLSLSFTHSLSLSLTLSLSLSLSLEQEWLQLPLSMSRVRLKEPL
jgi:NO-binding membrane sensor protein with MHYT domain